MTLPKDIQPPSYILESSKYARFCVSALLLTASNIAASNLSGADIPSSSSYGYYQQNNVAKYNFDEYVDFIDIQANPDYDQENAVVFSEFFDKLTSNMKTLPFEVFEDIAERPWDFV